MDDKTPIGQQDPTKTDINNTASIGKEKGIDALPKNLITGKFPAPLANPSILEGSLGDWLAITPVQFLPYPNINAKSGFTNPVKTGDDFEYLSFNKNNLVKTTQPIGDRVKTKREYYNFFEDYSTKQFTHLLDYFSAQKGIGVERSIPTGEYANGQSTQPNTKDIHLGSFIKTLDDNEDPTMLGYDIIIKWDDSPLFNGSIDNFITQYSGLGNSEIGSRQEILNRFKDQLFKFLKTDAPTYSNRPVFNGTDGVKTYYLRNITGLNNLNETNDSNKIKSFVDYGNEFIGLEFHEDVSQNLGYLGSLYKSLSWSRFNGKHIIPENLLRFDVDIVITEVRKYNRIFKSEPDQKIEVYADLISKYTYSLYECQFFFQNLPHGDSLDMSNISSVDKYEIKFNYKYSTMKFSKFISDVDSKSRTEYNIDNRYDNISRVKSNTTNSNTISNGTITSQPDSYNLNQISSYDIVNGDKDEMLDKKTGEVEDLKDQQEFDDSFNTPSLNDNVVGAKEITPTSKLLENKALENLRSDLINAGINQLNRSIISQAALLNKTLERIRNTIPYAGRMSEPTNVYSKNTPLQNDLINAARNFVGSSIKSFFTKP